MKCNWCSATADFEVAQFDSASLWRAYLRLGDPTCIDLTRAVWIVACRAHSWAIPNGDELVVVRRI